MTRMPYICAILVFAAEIFPPQGKSEEAPLALQSRWCCLFFRGDIIYLGRLTYILTVVCSVMWISLNTWVISSLQTSRMIWILIERGEV